MNKKLFSILATAALTLGFSACSNDDVADNGTGAGGAGTTTGGVAFAAIPQNAGTRTSLDVTSSPKNFLWEIGDKIWTKDDNSTWQTSNNSVSTAAQPSYTFSMLGDYTNTNTYTVFYPGKNGTQDKVTIATNQTQAEPNTTTHFGEAGDNGIGTATWNTVDNHYNFTLNHKAAYIAFKPYYVSNIPPHKYESLYLQKIEIISDNNITGSYDITASGLTNETGGGNTLTLDLTKNNTYTYSGHTNATNVQNYSKNATGFKLDDAPNEAQSATYAVIAPGTHKLKVRYTIIDAVTQATGTIEQSYGSFNFEPGHFKAIRAKVDLNKLKDYSSWSNKYYMWDAQEPYWKDHYWDKSGWTEGQDQPRISYLYGDNYPKSKAADPTRWHHGGSGAFEGSNGMFNPSSAIHVPNANEMSWYAMKGDPHWDDVNAWTMTGHLYKGGMWFKKKSVLQSEGNFRSDKAADNTTDMRTSWKTYTNNSIAKLSTNPIPTAAAGNYFFLPALGAYNFGVLYYVGSYGYYWSSSVSSYGSNAAFCLYFYSGYVRVYDDLRYGGFPVVAFE